MQKLLVLLVCCFLGSSLFAQTYGELLSAAAEGNTLEVIKIVSSGSVDVNANYNDGMTALMQASYYGQTETAVKLVELGAGVNTKDSYGETALMFASQKGHTETVSKLVEMGTKINEKSYSGATALMSAASSGKTETAAKLVELGAQLDAKNVYGMTPIMFAASNGHTETVVTLAEMGAELNAKDIHGWTALSYAKKNGNTATANVIKKLGAFDDSMWENTRQKILLKDARAYLLKYTGNEPTASDQEIALDTLSKIYEGLLSEDLIEYDESTSAIDKEGNLDFLMGVKLEAGTPIYLSYTKTIAVLKNVQDVFTQLGIDKSCGAGYEIASIKNLKTDIEALRTELKSLKGIK
jgi:hypothetical protein